MCHCEMCAPATAGLAAAAAAEEDDIVVVVVDVLIIWYSSSSCWLSLYVDVNAHAAR